MKSTPLRRKTAMKKRRSEPRRGQPTPEEKEAIRARIYAETRGRCMLALEGGLGCAGRGQQLPSEGSVFERWHLVHLKAKRRFGWANNITGGCYHCHIELMHTKGIKLHANPELHD